MIHSKHAPFAGGSKRCVVAVHGSLSSGRLWARLADELGPNYRMIAPDVSGYGVNRDSIILPERLSGEVALLAEHIGSIDGPFHLVGHSYGGAIAFKIATSSRFASRVRSLTLIEPVLPTLLAEDAADRRVAERLARLARPRYDALSQGLAMEAIDKFTAYWNG